MVTHPLLSQATIHTGFSVLHFLVYDETVQQILRLLTANVSLSDHGEVRRPRNGHSSVIDVVKPIRIAETVLRQNNVLRLLTQQTDEHAPTLHGHVDAADAVAQALADASVTPLNLDEVARS